LGTKGVLGSVVPKFRVVGSDFFNPLFPPFSSMSPGAKLPFHEAAVVGGVCSKTAKGPNCVGWLTLTLRPLVERIVKGLAVRVAGGPSVPQFTESVPARAERLVTRL
jgi:hypothetical protein